AYRVFDYPTPLTTGVCDCCTDRRLMRELLTLDRRAIGAEHFRDWYDGAYEAPLPRTLWGYFLPRLLDLTSQGVEISTVAFELTLSRYPTGAREAWSEPEWIVLDAWQRAFLADVPMQDQLSLDDVLCMFDTGGWPLQALATQVLAWPVEALIDSLWSDWCRCFTAPTILVTPFWGDEEAAMDFYTSDGLSARIESFALVGTGSEERVRKAWDLVATLEMYRGRRPAR
ncbi:MAG: hypothetical protein AAFV86_22905, partial [Pseudomonadota bacterium]